MQNRTSFLFFVIALTTLLSACRPAVTEIDRGKPVVVASTTMVGDVVHQVGGELIDLHILLPVNSDPHSFSPAPRDIALVETARLVFLNGFNLEESLADLITANARGEIVTVSDGIQPILIGGGLPDKGALPESSNHPHPGTDPHVWMDPANVRIWTQNIAQALGEIDPENVSIYRQNAERYLAALEALENWILQQVEQIPPEGRVLVTDHDSLGYFATAYDFRIIGVVVTGGSTLSDPSAQQMAALEKTIAEFGTPAIFVGTTVNTRLAERVAEDTGTTLVALYTGSLSTADGPAPSYIEMMRYNVNAIVEALK